MRSNAAEVLFRLAGFVSFDGGPFKTRNPKAETRKKSETQNPAGSTRSHFRFAFPAFGLRPSAFFRVSDFGFRIP
jgi:hypothetical protein